MRGSAGAGARTVYFHGHFDVVPAQSREQFRPRRDDGRIVGRGSADMKGGLVSMLYGAAAARDLGLLGDGRIVLHFVCDEETGSVAGSGHLRATGMIDPGALAMLTAGADRRRRVAREPRRDHAARRGRGAAGARGSGASRGQCVRAHDRRSPSRSPTSRTSCSRAAPHTRSRARRRAARCWSSAARRAAARTSTSCPGAAWFSVDRRFNPEEDLDEELARLTRTIEEAASADRRAT